MDGRGDFALGSVIVDDRLGSGIGPIQYVALFAAFLSGLGLIVGIGLVIRWLVVR